MMGQDFNKIFKAEKENFEIVNWKFALDDVEDAFIYKYSGDLPPKSDWKRLELLVSVR